MSRVVIQPYKGYSRSAKAIAQALNKKRLLPSNRSNFTPRQGDVVINWGSSEQRFNNSHYINRPSAVAKAANKLVTFQELEGVVRLPEWSTNKETAKLAIQIGETIYCRTKLTGNSGSGIVIASEVSEVVDAPLYTRKVNCDQEYRVHVMWNGTVYVAFDVQEKRRRNLTEEERQQGITRSELIRNTDNGWVFCRGGVSMPLDVGVQAMKAAECLRLDFCGVDVGYNSETREATVFEVNTACGVEGTTLTNYVEMLKEMIDDTSGQPIQN